MLHDIKIHIKNLEKVHEELEHMRNEAAKSDAGASDTDNFNQSFDQVELEELQNNVEQILVIWKKRSIAKDATDDAFNAALERTLARTAPAEPSPDHGVPEHNTEKSEPFDKFETGGRFGNKWPTANKINKL